jgi:acetate kinase
MTVSLGGLDTVVFTGGVGERAAPIRRRTASRLAHLGMHVDELLNAHAEPDTDISSSTTTVRTVVVASREDLEIAASVEQVLIFGDATRAGTSAS